MAHGNTFFEIDSEASVSMLRLSSADGTNRLSRACVTALKEAIDQLSHDARPLVIAGNSHFFSVGADLNEIAALAGPDAYEFALMGQTLMNAIASFPAPVVAAIEGHCMGGGLDLALACHRRVASPNAIFGHRGAALGLMTGWGGTQRLPRLIGKGIAMELFVAAEKIAAAQALEAGMINGIAVEPVAEALRQLTKEWEIDSARAGITR